MSRYPRMVACPATGIVAIVRNEREARNFMLAGVIPIVIPFAVFLIAALYFLISP